MPHFKCCRLILPGFNIRPQTLFYVTRKGLYLKLTSPKLDTSYLSRDEEALFRCALALAQKDKANEAGALEIMRPLWPDVGQRPNIQGLQPATAAEVLLCAGILTGWIGSRHQIKGAQELARNLIPESIRFYEADRDIRKIAEALSEIAYCYWRDGKVNQARALLLEALERLSPAGLKRARVLLRLSTVEQSAGRYHDALKILTDNTSVFAKIRQHTVRGDYHNELAMTLEEIAVADKRDDYFQRALAEYEAAEHQFKLAKNHIYRASVKNNVAVVLTNLRRFKEAHKHLDQARELTVRFKDRTRTALVDCTRAELLIAEGKFKAAETAARRAASGLDKVGHQTWLADALISQATALARLGKHERAHVILQRAVEVAREADALNKAGLAALTLIEEVDHLPPETLQAAYQQALEWLADTQSRNVLSRLNAAALKVFSHVRKEIRSDKAIDILLSKPGNLDQKLLEYEHELIKQALAQANGSVTHAAKLLGKTYQGLAFMIETKHKDLMKVRTPVRRRTSKTVKRD